mgnify:CR=1 FL=1
MPLLGVTPADLLRNQPVEPGWYKCVYQKGILEMAKDKLSMNLTTTFTLEEPEGKEITFWPNSKAIGMTQGMIEAILCKTFTVEDRFEMEDKEYIYAFNCPEDRPGIVELILKNDKIVLNGKKLQIKLVNDIYQGRITNKIDGYASYRADTQPPF